MSDHRDHLDESSAATLPPCPVRRGRARSLVEQLAELDRLPNQLPSPRRPD